MTKAYRFVLVATLFIGGIAHAQVTSVLVNGQKTGAVIVQGDTIRWEIALPSGATSQNELWIDVNNNGRAEAGVDKLLFAFSQTDGAAGGDGPGDDDGLANGVIKTKFKNGLAPVKFVFVAKNNNVADTASFTVTALPSPPFTVSGTVSAPQGSNVQWILIEADPDSSQGMIFWMALTDANGNYTINFGSGSASFNPWRVRIDSESLGAFLAVRRDTIIILTGHHTGVNFQLIRGKVITGTVRDQSNNPIVGADPHLHDATNPQMSLDLYGRTDQNGFYSLVAPNGKYFMHLTASKYFDQWWNNKTSSTNADTITISDASPDTLRNINGVLNLAALIRGVVRLNGVGTFASISVLSTTPPYNQVASTGTNDRGEYDLTVGPGTYYIEFRIGDQFQHVQYYNNKLTLPADAVTVTLGQTLNNINANFTITSVKTEDGTPSTFALHQNYPNPFNPKTTITYDIPSESSVRLQVYNVLGQQVALLVNEQQLTGRYTVSFDASKLPSGVYIYRLTSGGMTITKKMSVMK